MKHCVNCTKCCEAIAIRTSAIRNLRRTALVDIRSKQFINVELISISKRAAYKINPRLKLWTKNGYSFFKCSNLGDNGCNVYGNAPLTCSGYPWYNSGSDTTSKHSEISKLHLEQIRSDIDKPFSGGEYKEDCSYYPKLIDIVNV